MIFLQLLLTVLVVSFLIVIFFVYIYGLYSDCQSVIEQGDLIKTIEVLSNQKEKLLEQNEALMSEMALKLAQNEELQKTLIELNQKLQNTNYGLILVSVMVLGVLTATLVSMFYCQNVETLAAETVVPTGSVALDGLISNQVELTKQIAQIKSQVIYNRQSIDNLIELANRLSAEVSILSSRLDLLISAFQNAGSTAGPTAQFAEEVSKMAFSVCNIF